MTGARWCFRFTEFLASKIKNSSFALKLRTYAHEL